ncbi:MAG: tripartite tricarboxylate transporter substrate binding protein [Burkholderiales bacterium]|nr:tripartite tricarboxylate transporter substrate binding protein [Burkholderiales bacterium]
MALPAAFRSYAQPGGGSITLIVPIGPDGTSDRLGRLLAAMLEEIIGTSIRVENIAGDHGVTGTNAIAAAPRDGSVLGYALSSPMIAGRLLSKAARFNPIEDFDWLGIVGSVPVAMVLSTRSNQTSIEQWLVAARDARNPIVCANYGIGTPGHLAAAYLRLEQKANLAHVFVESAEEGYPMLADGRAEVLFDDLPNAMVKVPRYGHRIIAVTSADRLPILSEVPCFGELWRQSFVLWVGLVLPKGVPPAVYARLAAAVSVLFGQTRHADSLRAAGLAFIGLSGAKTREFVENDFLRNAALIAKLRVEGPSR